MLLSETGEIKQRFPDEINRSRCDPIILYTFLGTADDSH